MSLLLVFFYFIGIPALVIAAAVWLWRRSESSLAQGLVMVGAMATLAGLLWLAQGETWQADKQVRELCAKDGGVRVYETVTLPADKFNQWGQINFYRPDQGEDALGSEYMFRQDIHYYQKGGPVVSRTHYQVIRRSDYTLLGETVFYGRGGGDMPGPWHDSSYVCPPYAIADSMALLKKLFVPKNEDSTR